MFDGWFFAGDKTGEEGVQALLLRIAADVKNVFIFVAVIYLIVTAMKLIFSSGKDEEMKNAIQSLIWTIIGIMVMQSAYTVIMVLFNRGAGGFEAKDFLEGVVYRGLHFIELAASFLFIIMGIYAFYKIITSPGDSKSLDAAKMTIINAIIGFLVIKIAWALVGSLYGTVQCQGASFMGIQFCNDAISDPNLSDTARLIAVVVTYINGFLFLFIVLAIIYAGWLILSSQGDAKKIDKAKRIIKYVFIGLLIIVVSVILFNFFAGR